MATPPGAGTIFIGCLTPSDLHSRKQVFPPTSAGYPPRSVRWAVRLGHQYMTQAAAASIHLSLRPSLGHCGWGQDGPASLRLQAELPPQPSSALGERMELARSLVWGRP